MKQPNKMKRDVEGDYVASIIEQERNPPRSLSGASRLRLCILSPNARYYIFASFFALALAVLMIVMTSISRRHWPNEQYAPLMPVILALIGFVVTYYNARRTMHAIQDGISVLGRVESINPGQTTMYSTPEGMRNGSIRATITYKVNGLPSTNEAFIDRPWVRLVKQGTQLRLLVDPDSQSVLYVIGVAPESRSRVGS